jgi:hypothetical protein
MPKAAKINSADPLNRSASRMHQSHPLAFCVGLMCLAITAAAQQAILSPDGQIAMAAPYTLPALVSGTHRPRIGTKLCFSRFSRP